MEAPWAYDKQQAQHEFTRWSESYDRGILQWLLFGPSHRALIKRIKAVAADRPIKILDIGCGTGILAAKLRDSLPLCKVWGIDLNAEMLGQGRERWQRNAAHVQAVQGDSEQLPFDADVFDFVTCANSFHHYPNQAKAVAEMNRVLKPGGRLMIIDGYRDAPYGWLIYDVCVAAVEGEVHHASSRQFRELFEQAGLQAIAQRVHRGFAPFLFNEAVAAHPVSAIPEPHFLRTPASQRESVG